MRKRHLEVFEAWERDESNVQFKSVWTDGASIYSYDTCILTEKGDKLVFNATKYTHTTSEIQNNLRTFLSWYHSNIITVVIDAPQGIMASELKNSISDKYHLTELMTILWKVAPA